MVTDGPIYKVHFPSRAVLQSLCGKQQGVNNITLLAVLTCFVCEYTNTYDMWVDRKIYHFYSDTDKSKGRWVFCVLR